MNETEMNPSDGSQNAMILGEMRGQLREVVHSMNNLSSKFDGLTREVIALGALATSVGKLEAIVESQEIRIKANEAKLERQSGAAGVVSAILRSPVLGWMFLAAVMLYTTFKGRLP